MTVLKRRIRIENPVMGVPITFLGKHNPEQFKIVGHGVVPAPLIGGVKKYARIFVRRSHKQEAATV